MISDGRSESSFSLLGPIGVTVWGRWLAGGCNRCEDAVPSRVGPTVTSSTIKSVTTSTRFVQGRKIVTKKYVRKAGALRQSRNCISRPHYFDLALGTFLCRPLAYKETCHSEFGLSFANCIYSNLWSRDRGQVSV